MPLTEHQIKRLDELVSCPFKASPRHFPLGAAQLVYECWVALLYKHLPEPIAANLLMSGTEACRSIYDEPYHLDDMVEEQAAFCDPAGVQTMTADEFKTLESWLVGSRHDLRQLQGDDPGSVRGDIGYESHMATVHTPAAPRPVCGVWLDQEFERMTGWLQRLQLADAKVRDKHWPPAGAASREQVVAHSATPKGRGIGWFFRGTDMLPFQTNALAVLSRYFYCELSKRTKADRVQDRVEEFLQLWTELFEVGTFRLGIKHKTVTGAWNGAEVIRMVYDFDRSASQFHCFPVDSMPPVRDCFLEGQLDF